MNELVVKKAMVFSLILGAFLGLFSLIPPLIGFGIFILSFLSAIIVILLMKKNEKHLGIVDYEQGAILGGVVGFFASVGFFISFCPMVMVISLIFTKYYTYGIPYIIQEALWLFFIIILMVSIMIAMVNAVGGMAMTFIFNKIETKPQDADARLEIEIDD